MLPEPVEHRRHRGRGALGRLTALGRKPTPGPAGELAFDIALGAAELAEPDFARRHEMEIGEGVDQRLADAPVEFRPAGEFGGDVVTDDETAAPFLDDEDRADDADVLAQQEAARRQLIAPVQYRQDAVLAAHVVRAGRDRAQGRPADDEFPGAEAEEIGQIGLAAGKLAHKKRPFRTLQMGTEIRFKPARIEALVRALVDQLRRLQVHFLSSTRATARLWTSSGPSTMRITRERAQA